MNEESGTPEAVSVEVETGDRKVVCTACGAKVRIPGDMPLAKARCPRCRNSLDPTRAERLPSSIGPFKILRRIASGGMGIVYEGERNGRVTAVKALTKDAMEDENLVERFQREAALGQALDHPQLVKVFESGEDEGRLYMSMERIAGENLSRQVKRHGPVAWRDLIPVMRDVLSATDYLHQTGVIHRDLKPGNVILAEHGGKVIDLGLAKTMDPGLVDSGDVPILTLVGDQLGTPSYMAPEQVSDSATVTEAADVYGFGATFYYALAGKPPFDGDNALVVMEQVLQQTPARVSSVNGRVAPAIDELIDWCMVKEPGQRPGISELLTLLDDIEQEPDAVHLVRDRRRDQSFSPPWMLLLGVCVVIVIILATVLALVMVS